MDDVDIRHGTSVRPEQHVCPPACTTPVCDCKPTLCIPSPTHPNTQGHKYTNTQIQGVPDCVIASHHPLTQPGTVCPNQHFLDQIHPTRPIHPIPSNPTHLMSSQATLFKTSHPIPIVTANHIVRLASAVTTMMVRKSEIYRLCGCETTSGNMHFVQKINCSRFLLVATC